MTEIDRKGLLAHLKSTFKLNWQGIHGAPHWARVKYNGLRLAPHTGARTDVVELFAFLHDHARVADIGDPGHGQRAAEQAEQLRNRFFEIDDHGFALLQFAMTNHSTGDLSVNPTIQTCWDADRLDLYRVGEEPRTALLSSTHGKMDAFIYECMRRSVCGKTHDAGESTLLAAY